MEENILTCECCQKTKDRSEKEYKDLTDSISTDNAFEKLADDLKKTEDLMKANKEQVQDLLTLTGSSSGMSKFLNSSVLSGNISKEFADIYKECASFWDKIKSGETGLNLDDEIKELNRLIDNISKATDLIDSDKFREPFIGNINWLKEVASVYEENMRDMEKLNDLYEEQKRIIDELAKAQKELDSQEKGSKLDEEKSKLESLKREKEALEEKRREFEEAAQEIEDYKKANDLAGKSEEELQKELEETYKK